MSRDLHIIRCTAGGCDERVMERSRALAEQKARRQNWQVNPRNPKCPGHAVHSGWKPVNAR